MVELADTGEELLELCVFPEDALGDCGGSRVGLREYEERCCCACGTAEVECDLLSYCSIRDLGCCMCAVTTTSDPLRGRLKSDSERLKSWAVVGGGCRYLRL